MKPFVTISIALLIVFSLFTLSCGDEDPSTGSGRAPDDYDNTEDDDDVTDDDSDDPSDDDDDNDDNDDAEGPYYQDFLRYWQTLDQGYAYFIEKNIDWDAVFEANSDRAFNMADSVDFQLLIARITASFGDSHTWSYLPSVPRERLPFRSATGVCLHRIEDAIFVSRLSTEAETEGMLLGDEIVTIDGEAVDDVLERAVSWEGCSSPHCCDFFRLAHVERYSHGEDEVVYGVSRGDDILEFEMDRGSDAYGTCKPAPLVDFLADASGTVLRYKPIDGDLGYMHLSTLSESSLNQILQELDQALADFAGRSGLIFDTRYNHGGSDLNAMAVLARFLNQVVVPVSFRYKNGPAHDDFTPWLPEPVLPGVNPVSVPVVFLINGGCVSAADFFVAAASYAPTVTLLGTPSYGATGAPDHDTLPGSGITYYYSRMQRKYRATGEQIEGIGIAPDILVELDEADLAVGIDTQLEEAIARLRQ